MELRYNYGMAESDKTPSSATTPTNSLGLRAFNATGRDDTTTNIIKTKQDPKRTQRNMALIAVVIAAFIGAAVITFQRSGLKWEEIFSEEQGKSFGSTETKQHFED